MLKRTRFSLVLAVCLSVCSFVALAAPDVSGPRLASPLVVVQDALTGKILFSKNSDTSVSMASLTKLMTAMVFLDGPTEWLDLPVTIDDTDVDTLKHSSSRVPIGSIWTRRELLHLALMASDNRAAHALGRVYPGGVSGMTKIMNAKARSMGLTATFFEDTSGLSPNNRTTPLELAYMTSHAAQYALIREFSTDLGETFYKDGKTLVFKNTNAVVRDQKWPSLWLSKTGFTNEAGRCVTMMGRLAGKDITLVLMAGVSSAARTLDIQRVQHWLDGSEFQLPVLVQSKVRAAKTLHAMVKKKVRVAKTSHVKTRAAKTSQALAKISKKSSKTRAT